MTCIGDNEEAQREGKHCYTLTTPSPLHTPSLSPSSLLASSAPKSPSPSNGCTSLLWSSLSALSTAAATASSSSSSLASCGCGVKYCVRDKCWKKGEQEGERHGVERGHAWKAGLRRYNNDFHGSRRIVVVAEGSLSVARLTSSSPPDPSSHSSPLSATPSP